MVPPGLARFGGQPLSPPTKAKRPAGPSSGPHPGRSGRTLSARNRTGFVPPRAPRRSSERMALTIVVRSAEGKSAPRITFDAPRIVIGRGDGCEVRLPDPSVSHRHASIRQRGSDYVVVDEGSTNGTFVGPVRLSPQAPRVVRSGELVRIGRIWLELTVESVP